MYYLFSNENVLLPNEEIGCTRKFLTKSFLTVSVKLLLRYILKKKTFNFVLK